MVAMSLTFVLTLTGVILALLILRLVVPALPLRSFTRRLSALDAALIMLGALGLVVHCVSMFFRPLLAAIPGTEGMISQINSMGTASIMWYVVPAVMVMVGLRKQHWVAQLILAAALLAVGVTMYDGTPISVHLYTIFAAGVVIPAIIFLLATPPWQRSRTVNTRHRQA